MTSLDLSTLYLCYFGLREPLVQTQVLPYLRQLAEGGVRVHLLTFEPELKTRWSADDLKSEAAKLRASGVEWFCLPYHKRPSLAGTCYDILAGARAAVQLSKKNRVDALHARAHTALAMALLAQKWKKFSLVFDVRGLMAEEYADAGIWSEDSLAFRLVKSVERSGLRRADQVVVLTRKMRDWLVEKKLAAAEKIEVIPCCVDFSRFDTEMSDERKSERFEVVYAGSVSGLYLLEEMGRFFLHLKERKKDAFLRILTTSAVAEAEAVLRRVGLGKDDYWIGPVAAREVPAYLRRARVGLSFRKATFSQIAASPTKIPEYLAAGLPVVCNAGVGDTDDLLRRERVGIVISSLAAEEYAAAATRILDLLAEDGLAARCASVAEKYFDLSGVGRDGYLRVYRRLANQSKPISQHRA